ncbi:MAG: transglutaminase domain-containing protein [Armatimonadota bacterium]|nr:transglutaminase domain-containing protein [Armatimonadota bacterium]
MAAEQGYLRRVGPLLLAGAVACSAAAAGLTGAVEEPAFELLLHAAIIVGVLTSALLGSRGLSSTIVGIVVIAVAVAAIAQRMAPIPLVEILFPSEVIADEDLTIATLLAWMMVGFCFMLARRQNILFPLVAALSSFALTGMVNLNTVMLVDFGIFIFAVIFIWGYEHLLNVSERAEMGGGQHTGDWLGIARTQALAGTMLVAVLLALGIAVGTGLHFIGPRLYVGPVNVARYAHWVQRSLLAYGGVFNTFLVGQGPVNLPPTPAIRVRSDRPALWRGAVYDRYTGSGWTRELRGTARLAETEDGWLEVPGWQRWAGEPNRQIVTMLTTESKVVYAAARPARARITERGWQRTRMDYRPELDSYGALHTDFTTAPGSEFEVISIMPPTDPQVLRATPTDYSRFIRRTYIDQMQVQAEAALAPLVEEITAEAQTPYDKVIAIRDFLGSSCVYTLRAPRVPHGSDVAAHFVTRGRRGACDLFATSLAVMCRLAGVPARIATGFQTGDWDPEQQAYVARQRDAHAWAEVYFPTIGWVPFDVVAERSEAESLWALLQSAQWRYRAGQILERVWTAALVIAAVLALASAVLGPGVLLRWLRGRTRRKSSRQRMGEVFEWFRRRAARLAGIRPERWRTPAEVQRELADAGLAASPRVHQRLEQFTERFYNQRYGRQDPDDQQVRQVRAEARRLIADLRRDLRQFGRQDGTET